MTNSISARDARRKMIADLRDDSRSVPRVDTPAHADTTPPASAAEARKRMISNYGRGDASPASTGSNMREDRTDVV